MKRKYALTLIEVITVMVIISILVVIAVPNYIQSRVKVLDKQGRALVELIRAAERAYFLNARHYFPPDHYNPAIDWCTPPGVGSGGFPGQNLPQAMDWINGNLSLDLVNDGRWEYCINKKGSDGFIANLTVDLGVGTHSWWITNTMYNGSCSSTNPNAPCNY